MRSSILHVSAHEISRRHLGLYMGDLDDDLPVLAVAGADLRKVSTVVQVEHGGTSETNSCHKWKRWPRNADPRCSVSPVPSCSMASSGEAAG